MPSTTAKPAAKPMVKKVCPRCKKRKLCKGGFYPDAKNPTGYRTYCIECAKAQNARYKAAGTNGKKAHKAKKK